MDKKAILEALNKELDAVKRSASLTNRVHLTILYSAQIQAYEKAIRIVENQ